MRGTNQPPTQRAGGRRASLAARAKSPSAALPSRSKRQLHRGTYVCRGSGGEKWKVPALVLHVRLQHEVGANRDLGGNAGVLYRTPFQETAVNPCTAIASLNLASPGKPVGAPDLEAASLSADPTAHQLAFIGISIQVVNIEVEEAWKESLRRKYSFSPKIEFRSVRQLGR